MLNPFKPTAGAMPPELIARNGLLDEFEYGLRQGEGAPGLLTIITGARGIGKTVMLNSAEQLALAHGWAVISQTATAGVFATIRRDLLRLAEDLGVTVPAREVTALTEVGYGLTSQFSPEDEPSWRDTGKQILASLATQETGLLISIDEIRAVDRTEIAQLAADVQYFIREGLPICLNFAGWPSAVSDLLSKGISTFLRGAGRIYLRETSVHDVAASYAEIFGRGRCAVEPRELQRAAVATEGHPFLIQLVGYYLWIEAETVGQTLKTEVVSRAIATAQRRNAHVVLEPALAGLSAKDRDVLMAMAQQDGPSAMGQLGEATVSSPSLMSKYRNRLLAAGLIESAGYGKVDFAIPGLRAYLRAD